MLRWRCWTLIHTGPNGIGNSSIAAYEVREVNDSGQVVGTNGSKPFFTGPDGVGITYLSTDNGEANDINNSGQVVGNISGHAFITGPNGTGITDLGELRANGINNSEQVTGAFFDGALNRAFITDNDGVGIRDIGSLGGTSVGLKINDSGQVTGLSTTEINGFSHAFVTGTNGSGMIDLGTMGGDMSVAYGINNLGEVVGYAGFRPECFCSTDAFLYSHGMMVNLSRLEVFQSAGWTRIFAVDINDHGQIAGFGTIGGVQHAFLLSGADEEFFRTYVPVPIPIPEPQTYAMLLAGLALLGVIARNRVLA
ncbi:HAF repeat-containing PEP-CTERM protein [Nitrosomonas oligotropha]|uniref:PEP-CTERM protein-sorting domain-containing protein n=1 Tax=Nitrosomonas oligotropha TaxID=42354 RepID=A0A1H8KPT1_9PROT|nr:HAF repeat-containing PEP-CTERM protein [Nitrosomonas oligotropha]SDW34377.1 PEP-CTERM protein-sorting domain-containing protein [Nitrosomonas oligotropha]SEN94894.1 PEP-CTERM protein-sorting domain-containing protein [Nitrosomonas oligotropha]